MKEADVKKVVDMIEKAYITVYGKEKWNSLTNMQKHDAVMIIVKDMHKSMEVV